ncbi:MAG: alpha/beta hydrolase [Kofleriaceae bacterium]
MLLDRPGAKLYYEVRGTGTTTLVFVCGGPTDADVYSGIAAVMTNRYRVVTYDPRGNSRSVMDDPNLDQDMDVHGDDLAALIEHVGGASHVFGNSGGGQIAMNCAARHPEAIRTLIAHEPPCIRLLPDADEVLAGMGRAQDLGQTDVMAGFTEFMKLTGIDMAPPPGRKQETSDRMRANLTYFVRHGLRQIASYRPELDRLKTIVVGVGTESAGQLAHRTGTALAAALGRPATPFPGGHGGYGRYIPEFAAAIAAVL